MPYTPAEQVILQFAASQTKTRATFEDVQKAVAKAYDIDYLSNDRLLAAYRHLVKKQLMAPDAEVEHFLRMKKVRSLSGIVVVSVLTKPYPCPGKCLYCPTVDTLPKSYVEFEPAVMRAQQNNFDPYLQTQNRLQALEATGHPLSKINLRIIGGTWSYYPKAYQTWFIKRCFQACNDFGADETSQHTLAESQTLEAAQRINEAAPCRLVEISIETRQDYITRDEILRLRKHGVTKVELGVQSLYDDVLRINHRGHEVAETIRATKMLKDAGFKVSYQMMLNLPGSTKKRDFDMMYQLFNDPAFKPDYLKIYPLAIVKSAEVYDLYKQKKFRPYTTKELTDLICKIKTTIPPYVRVERVIRDISSTQIVAGGAKVSNLRQIALEKLKAQGLSCQCIRCRQAKVYKNEQTQIVRRDYAAADGTEIFLSIEDQEQKTLYALLRLRIPTGKPLISALKDAALVRDIHTYGYQMDIGQSTPDAAQHRGYGKALLAEAERLAKEFGKSKLAIIAGVGAREYFRKFGYSLEATYMVKKL